ncbi:oligosaccharide flippase family protein [uncultured Parabacteroides sp.]|uniref:oligosaccharide flippase family protein n=1 Tax=uncultured Parabacteroides sp. TaxID=512312 RepID=UPI0026313455|nr:oligosaccharide flippase family protein [uncultured Parabacteroides sp.]
MIDKIEREIKKRKSKDAVVNRVVKASVWSLIGSIIAKIIVLLSTMIVARILTVEHYGQLGIIRTTIMMFVVLAGVGMGTTAAKFIAQYRDSDKDKALHVYLVSNIFAFFMAVITAVTIFLLSTQLAIHSLNNVELAIDMKIASFMLFFCILNGAQLGTLQGFEDFRSIACVSFITALAEAIFVVLGAYFFNLLGAVTGYSISFLITTFTNFYFIKKHLKIFGSQIFYEVRELKFSDFKVVVKFGVPLAVSSLIMLPVNWWVRIYLIQTSGYSEMAYFDVADQWKNQILYIPGILSGIILPILSNTSSKSDTDFWKIVKLNFATNVIIALVLALGVILFKNLILLGYGEQYQQNSSAFVIMCLTAVVVSISNITVPILVSKNCVIQGLIFNVILTSLIFFFSYHFINNGYGAYGLSIGMLLSYSIIVILQFVFINYKKKVWNLEEVVNQ